MAEDETRATRSAGVARAIWAAAEPFGLWGLFLPETVAAMERVGLSGQLGYLVSRAAPLGAAVPAVVVAAFRSLPAAPIEGTLPRTWETLAPAEAVSLTHEVVSAAAARCFAGSPLNDTVAGIAELLDGVVAGLDTTGRPLAAAGQAVALPSEPWARAWRQLTTVREYRGDGHVATLVAAGLDPAETEYLMVAWAGDRMDTAMLRQSRQLSEEIWQQARTRLAARGLVGPDGGLTPAGESLRDGIERTTDAAAAPAFASLGDADLQRLWTFAAAASTTLVDAGQMRAVTPVGADWPPPPLPDAAA